MNFIPTFTAYLCVLVEVQIDGPPVVKQASIFSEPAKSLTHNHNGGTFWAQVLDATSTESFEYARDSLLEMLVWLPERHSYKEIISLLDDATRNLVIARMDEVEDCPRRD